MYFDQRDLPTRNVIRELNHVVQRMEHSERRSERVAVSTGCRPFDRFLGRHEFMRGSLVEWLGDELGSGASVLALVAAREACQDGGTLVVVDRDATFYPPAAAAWQIDLQNTILVRPQNEKDEHWALDQALRCEHVAAVLAWSKRIDGYTFRRLQLAAKTSGC